MIDSPRPLVDQYMKQNNIQQVTGSCIPRVVGHCEEGYFDVLISVDYADCLTLRYMVMHYVGRDHDEDRYSIIRLDDPRIIMIEGTKYTYCPKKHTLITLDRWLRYPSHDYPQYTNWAMCLINWNISRRFFEDDGGAYKLYCSGYYDNKSRHALPVYCPSFMLKYVPTYRNANVVHYRR